jgi:ADP-ribose pyrophosphatase YjhB (NUDIX family)
MPEQQESPSFINLAVTLNSKGDVLVIKRVKKESGSDGSILLWAFPGGKQIIGETRQQCVERETLAETGYKIKSTKEITMRSHPQFPVIIVYHLCELVENQSISNPAEQWEVEEVKWVNPSELRTLFTTELNPAVAKELGI